MGTKVHSKLQRILEDSFRGRIGYLKLIKSTRMIYQGPATPANVKKSILILEDNSSYTETSNYT